MTKRDELLFPNEFLGIAELAQAGRASTKTIRCYEQIEILADALFWSNTERKG